MTQVQNGRYRYSVHNYSGQAEGPIERSGANVYVIVPRLGIARRFTPPATNASSGNLWRVVDLVVEGGRVARVEAVNDLASTPGSSGAAAGARGDRHR